MSKNRTFWNERLSAAAEEKAESEDELCDFKDEIERKYQLQDTAQNLRIVMVSGNVQEHSPLIKEEPEEESIILEEEQQPIMEDHTGRKRKRKFDPEELKVLVDGVKAHYHELKKQNVTITRRNAIWQEITNRVNAVGHKDRTPSEIKRRWQDARRRTKEKVATNSASVVDTGGGPSEHVPLDTIEEQVLLTLCEEQVNGIPGIDALISDHDLCESPLYNSTTASASSSQPPPAAPPPPPPRQKTRKLLYSDHAILLEMKAQNTSIHNGLSVLTKDIKSISKVARALRGDTRAISRHTRELVSAVTGLTAAVQDLTKAVSERRPTQQENGDSAVHTLENPVGALNKETK